MAAFLYSRSMLWAPFYRRNTHKPSEISLTKGNVSEQRHDAQVALVITDIGNGWSPSRRENIAKQI